MRRKYIWHDGGFVDVTNWQRPPSRFPAIIRDACEPMQHPATGQIFDSKSRFREVTKAHGLVEVGNDYLTNRNTHMDTPKERKADIAQAIEMLEQGYRPPPDESVAEWGETRVIEADERNAGNTAS